MVTNIQISSCPRVMELFFLDFLGSLWNITSYCTSHALSEGSPTGSLRRYQPVIIAAVPLALSPPRAGRVQEWALARYTTGMGHLHPEGCFRLQAVLLVIWTRTLQQEAGHSSRHLFVSDHVTFQDYKTVTLIRFHKHCLAPSILSPSFCVL